jgi:hypothetical protein
VFKVYVYLLSCHLILALNGWAAIDVGGESHHPEALQRLIEMELRSKSKQAAKG